MNYATRSYVAFIWACVVGHLLGFGYESSLAQQEELNARGQFHYQRYCEVCHGATGQGDGALKEYLSIPPADLTQLQKKNAGEFPFWEVYRTIDGRKAIKGHGTREMPIWGSEIQLDTITAPAHLQEDLVAGRIWQLILYLQALQQ